MDPQQDDGHEYKHTKIPYRKCSIGCVLCCRLCFFPDGRVKEREGFHNDMQPKDGADTVAEDAGRKGHNASVLCSVCNNVYLCDSKPRFPGATSSCWNLWHSQKDLCTGITRTLCNVHCPRNEGWDTYDCSPRSNSLHISRAGNVVHSLLKPRCPSFGRARKGLRLLASLLTYRTNRSWRM